MAHTTRCVMTPAWKDHLACFVWKLWNTSLPCSTKRGTSTSGAYHVIFGDQLLIETDVIAVQEIRIHRNTLHMYMNCTYSVGVV